MTVRSLGNISQKALDRFYDENSEHGNYEGAAEVAIDCAITMVVELMEPKPAEGEKSIADLYWESVST